MAAAKKNADTKVNESPNYAPGDVGVTTPAGASIVAHNPVAKSDLLKMIVTDLSKRSHEDLTDFFKKSMAQIGDEAVAVPGSDAPHNKSTLEMKPSAATPGQPSHGWGPLVKEDIAIVTEGTEYSDETKEKLALLFEAQVNLRLTIEKQKLIEENEVKLAEAIEAAKVQIAESVDGYLDDMAEDWAEDNKIAIQSSLRNELFENFMDGLKELFTEHYIDVPQDKIDVLETLTDRVAELEAKVNEGIDENVELKKNNSKLVVAAVFAEVAEGMVLTDVEKLRTLTESVQFTDVEKLRKDLKIIKEANFKTAAAPKAKAGVIAEETEVTVEGVEGEDGLVEVVVDAKPSNNMAHFLGKQARAAKAVTEIRG